MGCFDTTGPLINGEKEETGLIQEVTSSPKRWMRGLNATLVGTSLMVQWLRRHTSNTGDAGLIPGGGTRTPYTL